MPVRSEKRFMNGTMVFEYLESVWVMTISARSSPDKRRIVKFFNRADSVYAKITTEGYIKSDNELSNSCQKFVLRHSKNLY